MKLKHLISTSAFILAGIPTNAQGQQSIYMCKSCPAGTYSAGGTLKSCTPCSKGQYQNLVGASSCKACPAGQYSSTTGASSCSTCPAGTYSKAGSTSCTKCPANSTSSAGAKSIDDCICNTGYKKSGNSCVIKTCTLYYDSYSGQSSFYTSEKKTLNYGSSYTFGFAVIGGDHCTDFCHPDMSGEILRRAIDTNGNEQYFGDFVSSKIIRTYTCQ
ncbi:MAG: hypothetical protein K6F04_01110 [bacterium]|nr:hypothetical protein [bacterium]